MAIKQELEITIDSQGHVTVHVRGISGPRCLEATRALQEALGETVRVEKTTDYYAPQAQQGRIVETKE